MKHTKTVARLALLDKEEIEQGELGQAGVVRLMKQELKRC